MMLFSTSVSGPWAFRVHLCRFADGPAIPCRQFVDWLSIGAFTLLPFFSLRSSACAGYRGNSMLISEELLYLPSRSFLFRKIFLMIQPLTSELNDHQQGLLCESCTSDVLFVSAL